jgi:hypothetical protein
MGTPFITEDDFSKALALLERLLHGTADEARVS